MEYNFDNTLTGPNAQYLKLTVQYILYENTEN